MEHRISCLKKDIVLHSSYLSVERLQDREIEKWSAMDVMTVTIQTNGRMDGSTKTSGIEIRGCV